MPLLSAFTPCGALALSGAPSRVEQIYKQLGQLLGGPDGPFDPSEGTHAEAKMYAWARGLARAALDLDRAGNQQRPLKAYDLIPLLELDYELSPGPNDGYVTRQRAIAAAKLAPRGATASNIVNGLRLLLGADFLAYVVATASGTDAWTPTTGPASPGIGPGVFSDVRVAPRLLQLIDPVVASGTQWVAYENWDTSASPLHVAPSDVLTVQGEVTAVAEQVTVLAVASSPPAGPNASSGACFQAAFTKPHDAGASITTGPFPFWWSTQRQVWIVVSSTAALDPSARRRVNEFMRKVSRGVTQWAIVAPTSTSGVGGTVGPLTVNGAMGAQATTAFTYQNSG